jgi:hypothetical protein
MRRLVIALVVLSALAAPAGEPSAAVDAVLADALAVLRINDPRVVERETTQFAATLGIEPQPIRSAVGRLLFHSAGLDGIDLSRPALLAWRPGPAPLVAIIPLKDRRLFLDQFGDSLGTDAPLIRVGEREGTVVYSQNGNDGLIEYRLLVSDRAAYLARSVDECRQLASHPLQPALTEPPLTFTASSAWLAGLSLDPALWLGGPRGEGPDLTALLNLSALRSLAGASWAELVPQLSGMVIELRPDADGMIKLQTRVLALPDSPLAIWISNQRNQPSRLLPVVAGAKAALSLTGNIVWQGQADRAAQPVGELLKATAGDRWSPVVEETWHSICSIVDRCGPFAAALDLDAKGTVLSSELRLAGDQPRAGELSAYLASLVQAVSGTASAPLVAGGTGFRIQPAGGVPAAVIGSERWLVATRSSTNDVEAVSAAILARAGTLAAPEGAPGVFMLGVNLTQATRVLSQLLGGTPQPVLPPAAWSLVFKIGGPGQLVIDSTLPVQKIAQLVRDTALLQLTGNDPKPKR